MWSPAPSPRPANIIQIIETICNSKAIPMQINPSLQIYTACKNTLEFIVICTKAMNSVVV